MEIQKNNNDALPDNLISDLREAGVKEEKFFLTLRNSKKIDYWINFYKEKENVFKNDFLPLIKKHYEKHNTTIFDILPFEEDIVISIISGYRYTASKYQTHFDKNTFDKIFDLIIELHKYCRYTDFILSLETIFITRDDFLISLKSATEVYFVLTSFSLFEYMLRQKKYEKKYFDCNYFTSELINIKEKYLYETNILRFLYYFYNKDIDIIDKKDINGKYILDNLLSFMDNLTHSELVEFRETLKSVFDYLTEKYSNKQISVLLLEILLNTNFSIKLLKKTHNILKKIFTKYLDDDEKLIEQFLRILYFDIVRIQTNLKGENLLKGENKKATINLYQYIKKYVYPILLNADYFNKDEIKTLTFYGISFYHLFNQLEKDGEKIIKLKDKLFFAIKSVLDKEGNFLTTENYYDFIFSIIFEDIDINKYISDILDLLDYFRDNLKEKVKDLKNKIAFQLFLNDYDIVINLFKLYDNDYQKTKSMLDYFLKFTEGKYKELSSYIASRFADNLIVIIQELKKRKREDDLIRIIDFYIFKRDYILTNHYVIEAIKILLQNDFELTDIEQFIDNYVHIKGEDNFNALLYFYIASEKSFKNSISKNRFLMFL